MPQQGKVSDRVDDGYPHKVDPQDVQPRYAKLLGRQLLTSMRSRHARPWKWAGLASTVPTEANRLQLSPWIRAREQLKCSLRRQTLPRQKKTLGRAKC